MRFKFKILNKLKQDFNKFINQDHVAKYGDKILILIVNIIFDKI